MYKRKTKKTIRHEEWTHNMYYLKDTLREAPQSDYIEDKI